jgi:uncharacterized membrane protein
MSASTTHPNDNDLKLSLRSRRAKGAVHKHPVNQLHHDEATFGELLADRISAGIGSWTFLIVQTAAVLIWLVGNAILFFHFDPRPFILLNLLFSLQAAYTGPVLLLAGNRQAQKDRLTLEHACAEADKADLQNVQILKAIEQNTEVMLTILRHVETLVSDHVSEKRPNQA